MDLSNKCAFAARAIRFISTHDDEPVAVVSAALDALTAFVAKEKEALLARAKSTTEAAVASFDAALK